MYFEITLVSVTSTHAQIPHGNPGGSHGHGHVEVSRVHVGRYSMPVVRMSQEGNNRQSCPAFIYYREQRSGLHVEMKNGILECDQSQERMTAWNIEDWVVPE